MQLPIRFKNEEDAIAAEAAAFRRLSPGQRLHAIIDLIGAGMAILQHSPHREAMQRLQQAHEDEWRRAQKELFARHGY